VISQMARDFLAIPGAGVAVEWMFSSLRHVCADTCCSLKAETIKEWIRQGLLQIEWP
ncbi:hypothetical protein OBBRIDRAFT_717843, partial [Obba rivulosa]